MSVLISYISWIPGYITSSPLPPPHPTGTPLTRTPILAQKDLDLFRLYQLVQENGGMERVTQEMKWRSLYLQLGMTLSTNASHALKQAYKRQVDLGTYDTS